VADDGRTVLVQTDWDYPGTASTFGWNIADVQQPLYCDDEDTPCDDMSCPVCTADHPHCDHCGTDGTVDCRDCGVTASEFIGAAREWLENNDGAQAEDPGYFDEEVEA
jgi:hypothetical protein